MRLGIPGPGSRWTVVLLPLAWLAVVVVAAGLTWQVIDSAGRDVLTSSDSPLSATGTTSGAESASGGARPSPGDEDDRSTKSPRPSPSAPSATTGEATPSASQPGRPGPPSSPPSSRPSASSSVPSGTQDGAQDGAQNGGQPGGQDGAPSQQAQVRSWQGSAGTVTASCTGTAISLQSATPYDGWAVEVDDRGPRRVRVEFTSGGDDERETEVEAECSGGAPRYQVESND